MRFLIILCAYIALYTSSHAGGDLDKTIQGELNLFGHGNVMRLLAHYTNDASDPDRHTKIAHLIGRGAGVGMSTRKASPEEARVMIAALQTAFKRVSPTQDMFRVGPSDVNSAVNVHQSIVASIAIGESNASDLIIQQSTQNVKVKGPEATQLTQTLSKLNPSYGQAFRLYRAFKQPNQPINNVGSFDIIHPNRYKIRTIKTPFIGKYSDTQLAGLLPTVIQIQETETYVVMQTAPQDAEQQTCLRLHPLLFSGFEGLYHDQEGMHIHPQIVFTPILPTNLEINLNNRDVHLHATDASPNGTFSPDNMHLGIPPEIDQEAIYAFNLDITWDKNANEGHPFVNRAGYAHTHHLVLGWNLAEQMVNRARRNPQLPNFLAAIVREERRSYEYYDSLMDFLEAHGRP
jgi:hypothetical protein